ncbi:MAG: DUF1405 domain-containing protein [Candidatus Hodarchaeota archaeon]
MLLQCQRLFQSQLRLFIAALNIGGAIIVLYTNFWPRQMHDAPMYLWLFIPDCATCALLTAIAVLWAKQQRELIQLMAGTTCIQAGVSYSFLIIDQPQFLTPLALIAHLGLFFEGVVLMACLKGLTVNQGIGGLSWLVINNLIDITTDSMAYSLVLLPQDMLIVVWFITDLFLVVWTVFILQKASKSNFSPEI